MTAKTIKILQGVWIGVGIIVITLGIIVLIF